MLHEKKPTPLIFFNIGNEIALPFANKSSFTHTPLVQQMRQDLALLPIWINHLGTNAYTWLPRGSNKDLSKLQNIPIKASVLAEENAPFNQKELPYFELNLWGYEPTLIRSFSRLSSLFPNGLTMPSLGGDFPNQLFDRSLPSLLLSEWDGFSALSPYFCDSIESLDKAILTLSPFDSFLVKIPYSSSGRGILPFSFPLSSRQKEQLRQLLVKHKCIALEPLLSNKGDYALEYWIDEQGEVSYLGISHFKTQHFHYLYNIVSSPQSLWLELSSSIGEKVLEQIIEKHCLFIREHIAPFYSGPVGIDMLLYQSDKEVCIHPALEINVRGTMGYYAHKLFEMWGEEGKSYRMKIDNFRQEGEAEKFFNTSLRNNPPVFSDSNKLQKGILPLTLPLSSSHFFASLETVPKP